MSLENDLRQESVRQWFENAHGAILGQIPSCSAAKRVSKRYPQPSQQLLVGIRSRRLVFDPNSVHNGHCSGDAPEKSKASVPSRNDWSRG